jgi:hypothetical protein
MSKGISIHYSSSWIMKGNIFICDLSCHDDLRGSAKFTPKILIPFLVVRLILVSAFCYGVSRFLCREVSIRVDERMQWFDICTFIIYNLFLFFNR